MKDIDEEYRKMIDAQEDAELMLKDAHFYIQKIECCLTCRQSSQSTIECPLRCDRILKAHPGWDVGDIDPLGICEYYIGKKPDPESLPEKDTIKKLLKTEELVDTEKDTKKEGKN